MTQEIENFIMYMHEEMEDADGRCWRMVGLVPGKAVKKGRLVRFGYAVLTSEKDTILGPKGIRMPVHEFHYWDTTCESGCFEAVKPMTGRRWQCIYQKKQIHIQALVHINQHHYLQ